MYIESTGIIIYILYVLSICDAFESLGNSIYIISYHIRRQYFFIFHHVRFMWYHFEMEQVNRQRMSLCWRIRSMSYPEISSPLSNALRWLTKRHVCKPKPSFVINARWCPGSGMLDPAILIAGSLPSFTTALLALPSPTRTWILVAALHYISSQ